ncbi:hypothetical protein KIPB_000868 [Kipferlia bialata]|uniref:Uncharacterized protein n=1 Tax=Kipferlia bialata TaxID=797122 RepID=A0A9K3CPG7_9EUKA|nr:hypothetical protein KIPB_000868 [Kipferlia bialata]|eukprot:g868.t1
MSTGPSASSHGTDELVEVKTEGGAVSGVGEVAVKQERERFLLGDTPGLGGGDDEMGAVELASRPMFQFLENNRLVVTQDYFMSRENYRVPLFYVAIRVYFAVKQQSQYQSVFTLSDILKNVAKTVNHFGGDLYFDTARLPDQPDSPYPFENPPRQSLLPDLPVSLAEERQKERESQKEKEAAMLRRGIKPPAKRRDGGGRDRKRRREREREKQEREERERLQEERERKREREEGQLADSIDVGGIVLLLLLWPGGRMQRKRPDRSGSIPEPHILFNRGEVREPSVGEIKGLRVVAITRSTEFTINRQRKTTSELELYAYMYLYFWSMHQRSLNELTAQSSETHPASIPFPFMSRLWQKMVSKGKVHHISSHEIRFKPKYEIYTAEELIDAVTLMEDGIAENDLEENHIDATIQKCVDHEWVWPIDRMPTRGKNTEYRVLFPRDQFIATSALEGLGQIEVPEARSFLSGLWAEAVVDSKTIPSVVVKREQAQTRVVDRSRYSVTNSHIKVIVDTIRNRRNRAE